MKKVLVGTGLVFGLSAWVAPLAAGAQTPVRGDQALFVQTDNPTGNQVVAYDRAADGTLTLAGTYGTGGLGGVLNGSVVDHLASQGSLTFDRAHGVLYAVNADSDTVSVFAVEGDRLALRQVIDSGGQFPVSIAAHGDLVYVLNAKGQANVAGFRAAGDRLHAIHDSVRSLGLTIPGDTSQFTHTPGQVAFSPDGSQLVVTTKANGNDIDVFGVRRDGRLDRAPTVNLEAGNVPFGVAFDGAGDLLVANAGPDSLSTYALHRNGSLTAIDSVANGQAATCWLVSVGGYFYTSNAGGPSLSGYQEAPGGTLDLLGSTSTDPGTVDAAGSPDGRYLYVQTGLNGIVDEFQIGSGGALLPIGSVTVAGGAGGEGIVAS
ncbi:MAG TPA: hypothetical protein VG435_21170 [Acidimicrobiales bacterium]|jgi:DNA-binding beta-propeller fold protein YncE|nr:hypothetical protein [Acidimicrobiales bacterium]